jgi:hypothetical protein
MHATIAHGAAAAALSLRRPPRTAAAFSSTGYGLLIGFPTDRSVGMNSVLAFPGQKSPRTPGRFTRKFCGMRKVS